MRGFTRALSRELGPTGVTGNNMQTGAMDTELSLDDDGPAAQTMMKLMSVGRFGRPEEIASAVAFLASPDSAFINGESLMVDDGWNAYGAIRHIPACRVDYGMVLDSFEGWLHCPQ